MPTAFTLLLKDILTPWSRVLLEKLTGSQLVKKFPPFYGTSRFINVFTSAHHLSITWARLIQYMPPHPTSWQSILILSSHLFLGHPSSLFPSGFPTKTLYKSLLSPIHATCPANPILLDLITRTTLGSFFYSPVTSLLCTNILLSTLFTNTLSLHSSLKFHAHTKQSKL